MITRCVAQLAYKLVLVTSQSSDLSHGLVKSTESFEWVDSFFDVYHTSTMVSGGLVDSTGYHTEGNT